MGNLNLIPGGMMRRRILASVVALVALTAGCAAEDSEKAQQEVNAQSGSTGASGADSGDPVAGTAAKFGTMDSPCGKGDGKVKASEAGGGTDKLYLGVGNERSSEIRNGLLAEFWDTAVAFAKWCNAQGGVAGLPIEVVDLDGKVVAVEAAMAKACTGVFAIVGGGWAQDNQIFSGKDGSDFHKCKLIAIPGFAVSTDVSEGNGLVQPIPNPSYVRATDWHETLAKLYPDKIDNYGVVYGTLPSIEQNKEQAIGVAKTVDGFGNFGAVSYNPIGAQDWGVVAQQVRDANLELVYFAGEPANLSKFGQALKDQDYKGIVYADANQYDQVVIDASGPAAVEGLVIRIASHPFEEGDKWPATQQLLEILKDGNPAGKVASLNTQAFSAWLLFAQSAKACASKGEITRDCVLTEAKSVKDWDGGGLHTPTNPGTNEPPRCSMALQIKDGKFVRLFPELGSKDDNGDGFACTETEPVTITGDLGKGNVDPSRTA